MISIFNGRERRAKPTSGILINKTQMLAQLHTLKGAQLAVLMSYWLHRAEGHYPTSRDISEDTGYSRDTIPRIQRQLLRRNLIEPPICPRCHQTVTFRQFHRHHTTPSDATKHINICQRCHNKAKPR